MDDISTIKVVLIGVLVILVVKQIAKSLPKIEIVRVVVPKN